MLRLNLSSLHDSLTYDLQKPVFAHSLVPSTFFKDGVQLELGLENTSSRNHGQEQIISLASVLRTLLVTSQGQDQFDVVYP